MSVPEFRRAIDFIAARVLPRMGLTPEHFLTVEYLGGEVLLVPSDELEECVLYARQRLRPLVRGYRDGAQSNLIASPRRVTRLHDLFSGNLGTSWDSYTGRRHINGSPELYRGLLNRSLRHLDVERDMRPGRVLVIDRASAPYVLQEVRDAQAGEYDLVLRPVFQGGSEDVEGIAPDEMVSLMESCYDAWRAAPGIRIEPFDSLFRRRMARGQTDQAGSMRADAVSGCPFQSDCAFKSLSLDPDGTLHVCQEMADAGNYPLGNALDEEFDERTWRLLARRTAHLSDECSVCTWRAECGGGCMNEAIEMHGGPFARTEFCTAWKAIFRRIEADIASGDAHAIMEEMS